MPSDKPADQDRQRGKGAPVPASPDREPLARDQQQEPRPVVDGGEVTAARVAATPTPVPRASRHAPETPDRADGEVKDRAPTDPHPNFGPAAVQRSGRMVRMSSGNGQRIEFSINTRDGVEPIVLEPTGASDPVAEDSLTDYSRGLLERGLLRLRDAHTE
jgi:hypothetical protein